MTRDAPTSEAELADLIRGAAAARRPLAIRGDGTRGVGAEPEGDVLSTAGLRGITLYEPGALTLVARAGTPLAEVEAALAAEGQILAFEPWDARPLTGRNGDPTIGGVVATNASGPRRVQAGACRDSLIGVRFVDGTGAAVKNGGRVMKNVTGLDLVKLMAGSHGTLGVLTELAFKLRPRPEATVTVILDGLEDAAAGGAMRAAMASPFEVSGAAHLPGRAETHLRLEGFAGSVAHRAEALAASLARFGTPRVEEGPGAWAEMRDAAVFAEPDGAVWRISVRPTDGPAVGAALRGSGKVFYDWAGGLVWALLPSDFALRTAIAPFPGHATLVRADAATAELWGTFHPEPPAVAALSEAVRRRFDPAGILNPERIGRTHGGVGAARAHHDQGHDLHRG